MVVTLREKKQTKKNVFLNLSLILSLIFKGCGLGLPDILFHFLCFYKPSNTAVFSFEFSFRGSKRTECH